MSRTNVVAVCFFLSFWQLMTLLSYFCCSEINDKKNEYGQELMSHWVFVSLLMDGDGSVISALLSPYEVHVGYNEQSGSSHCASVPLCLRPIVPPSHSIPILVSNRPIVTPSHCRLGLGLGLGTGVQLAGRAIGQGNNVTGA